MKSNQASNVAERNRSESGTPTCPSWKKMLAGVLTIVAVALGLSASLQLQILDPLSLEMLTGLAVILGSSIALVVAGIALVTGVLWVISRSARIMSHARNAVAYIVHCYPQQLKDRILTH